MGFYLAAALLLNYNLEITATEDEKYDFLISVAKEETEFDLIVQRFTNYTQST